MRSYNSNALIRRASSGSRVPSPFDLVRPTLFDDPFALLDAAVSTSPLQLMRRMHEEMDRVFTQTFGEDKTPALSWSPTASYAPRVDVSETGSDYRIDMELPGIPQDAIDVRVIEGTLTISAGMQSETGNDKPEQVGSDERRYHYRERQWGRIERLFHLPPNVNEDDLRAEFKDGVLSVVLPKKEPQRSEERGGRRIAITSVGDAEQSAQPKALAGTSSNDGT